MSAELLQTDDIELQFYDRLQTAESAGPVQYLHELWDDLRVIIPRERDPDSLSLGVRLELFAFIVSPRRWTRRRILEHNDYYCLECTDDEQHFAILPEAVEYLQDRARQCNHAQMKVRYADLAWDLAGRIKGAKRDVEMARIVVDSTLSLVVPGERDFDLLDGMVRALSIALATKDQRRVDATSTALIEYETSVAQDSLPGTWGFSFDALWEHDFFSEAAEIKAKIVSDLHARFDRLCANDNALQFDPNHAEQAANRLLVAYRSLNEPERISQVFQTIGDAVRAWSKRVPAFLSLHTLQKLHNTLTEYGFRDRAHLIRVEIAKTARAMKSEMRPMEVVTRFSPADLYPLASHLCTNSLVESLALTGHYFIPRRRAMLELMHKRDRGFPLSGIGSTSIHGAEGHPVAHVGPAGTDEEARLMRFTTEEIGFASAHLKFAIGTILNTHLPTARMLTGYLVRTGVFPEYQDFLLVRGLEAYLEMDYVVAIHLLIPQIETALRQIVEQLGGSTLKQKRGDLLAFQQMTIDELLRHDLVAKILSEDIRFYFRLLLTDSRGWNLRNIVCHGLADGTAFDFVRADRLFHALLVLGLIRRGEYVT